MAKISVVDILVGPAPGVVNAHGVVGGDGTVEEAPARFAGVESAAFVEDAVLVPEREDGPFQARKID